MDKGWLKYSLGDLGKGRDNCCCRFKDIVPIEFIFVLSVTCYFVDSCPLRALQRLLEDPRALERALGRVFKRFIFKKLIFFSKLRIRNFSRDPPSP